MFKKGLLLVCLSLDLALWVEDKAAGNSGTPMKAKKWLITNRLLKKLKNSLFRPINNTNNIRHLAGRQAGLKKPSQPAMHHL